MLVIVQSFRPEQHTLKALAQTHKVTNTNCLKTVRLSNNSPHTLFIGAHIQKSKKQQQKLLNPQNV